MTDNIVDFLPKGVSEHALGSCKVFSPQHSIAPPFRFKNIWTSDPEFLNLVGTIWNQPVTRCAMFRLVTHLTQLKKVFKHLNGSKYKFLDDQVDQAKVVLDFK